MQIAVSKTTTCRTRTAITESRAEANRRLISRLVDQNVRGFLHALRRQFGRRFSGDMFIVENVPGIPAVPGKYV